MQVRYNSLGYPTFHDQRMEYKCLNKISANQQIYGICCSYNKIKHDVIPPKHLSRMYQPSGYFSFRCK